ncbi:MAG: TonB-dependent receptor [Bacteroidota bacterium]|nr:TonB-dependent receptor [Bacteroidota bacterium]
MKKKFFVVAAVMISSRLMAQQDSAFKQLDDVVITATKYPVKLSETGKVVTVITSQQIERSAGKDLSQLLNEQTGLVVNGANSNPGKDKSIFMRGASNEYTLILLDGIPVNDPSGSGGAFDLRLLPLNQVERIEILKGSQSTLYGSDAIAGVINIITKKNSKKPIGFTGGASYGSYNSFNGDAGLNGHGQSLDYSIGYSYTKTDGISEATDKTGIANFDKDGFSRHSVRANISWQPSKNIKITPFYRYSYYKGDFDAGAFTDGNNKFTALLNNAGAITSITLPKGTLTATYGYTYAKRNYINDFGSSIFRGRFHAGEVYLKQSLGKQVTMLAGMNYQDYGLLDTTLAIKNPHTSIVSPYLSFFIQSGTGLNIEAGGRYNNHSKFGSYFTYSLNTSYTINKEVKFFANISSGFKAPTVNELFGAFGANPALKPENSTSLEGGIHIAALQKKLALTATLFNRDTKNLVTYVAGQFINIDEQKDKGLELEAAYSPIEKITLKASYTYVTGHIQQSRGGKDTSYYNLIRRPKSTITLSLGYQATRQLYVDVFFQGLSKRTDLFFEPAPPYATEQVNLKAYALVNVYAEYKFVSGKLRLFADAKNITGSKYTEVYGYNTTGVTITGGIRIEL